MPGTKKLKSAELSSFCSQIALILSAGLPLYEGMETLASSSGGSEYADLYKRASDAVNATGTLYEALKQDDRWPTYLVEMVGIGETTGQLESVMEGLAKYYAREDRIRGAVMNAVTYPLVLSIMLVLIVFIMLWKVLPVFQRVLNSMGVGVSGSGRALMNLGSAIGVIVLVIVGVLILAVLVGAIMMRTSARDKVLSAVRKICPPIRRVSMKLASSRIASVLSMMLHSGFPTSEAFRLLPGVVGDGEAAKRVDGIRQKLDSGAGFADAISDSKLFDELQNRMIRMGVAAGREDQVMDTISQMYEDQVEESITQMVSIIEPTLIALLSVVIGAILLSVMLPMAGILTTMF